MLPTNFQAKKSNPRNYRNYRSIVKKRSVQKNKKMEEIDEVPIHLDFPEYKAHIGSRLSNELREQLIKFLKYNHDYVT